MSSDLEDRVARLEALARGECPECEQKAQGWKPVFGSFAPEWWATMRENGVNPATGHKLNCPSERK